LFYRDHAALVKYEDQYRDRVKLLKGNGTRKIGRLRKEGAKSRKIEPVSAEGEATTSQKLPVKRKTAKSIPATDSGYDQPVVPQKSAQKGSKRKRRDGGEEANLNGSQPSRRRVAEGPRRLSNLRGV